MKAVILAAGYATRLYPLTINKPKCLLTVGSKTILDSLCRKLVALKDLEEIIIVTNARFEKELSAWKEKAAIQAMITIINDGSTSNENRLGAIGDFDLAIRQCLLKDDTLLLASDNLFEQDFLPFLSFAKKNSDSVTVALHDIGDPRKASKKFGVLEIDLNHQVTHIEEKPENPRSSLIGMGVYFFPAKTLKLVATYLTSSEAKDAPGYYIHWLMGKLKIFGFVFSGLWYDIGDLQSLEEANKIFKEIK